MTIKVPTLTAAGWVENIGPKTDQLIAYFLSSQYSQSNLYRRNITSLDHILAKYGEDPLTVRQEVTTALEKYLERFFDAVSVIATTKDDDGGRYRLLLDIDVVENGKTYSVGKEILAMDSKVLKIMDRQNNG
jgi:hypothetical protein